MTSRAGSGSLDLSGASVIVAAFNGTDVLTSCARYRQLAGLLLWLFISPVVAFLLPYEIELAYAARGNFSHVRALTGLWILPPLVAGIVCFVKAQGAMNRLWAGS